MDTFRLKTMTNLKLKGGSNRFIFPSDTNNSNNIEQIIAKINSGLIKHGSDDQLNKYHSKLQILTIFDTFINKSGSSSIKDRSNSIKNLTHPNNVKIFSSPTNAKNKFKIPIKDIKKNYQTNLTNKELAKNNNKNNKEQTNTNQRYKFNEDSIDYNNMSDIQLDETFSVIETKNWNEIQDLDDSKMKSPSNQFGNQKSITKEPDQISFRSKTERQENKIKSIKIDSDENSKSREPSLSDSLNTKINQIRNKFEQPNSSVKKYANDKYSKSVIENTGRKLNFSDESEQEHSVDITLKKTESKKQQDPNDQLTQQNNKLKKEDLKKKISIQQFKIQEQNAKTMNKNAKIKEIMGLKHKLIKNNMQVKNKYTQDTKSQETSDFQQNIDNKNNEELEINSPKSILSKSSSNKLQILDSPKYQKSVLDSPKDIKQLKIKESFTVNDSPSKLKNEFNKVQESHSSKELEKNNSDSENECQYSISENPSPNLRVKSEITNPKHIENNLQNKVLKKSSSKILDAMLHEPTYKESTSKLDEVFELDPQNSPFNTENNQDNILFNSIKENNERMSKISNDNEYKQNLIETPQDTNIYKLSTEYLQMKASNERSVSSELKYSSEAKYSYNGANIEKNEDENESNQDEVNVKLQNLTKCRSESTVRWKIPKSNENSPVFDSPTNDTQMTKRKSLKKQILNSKKKSINEEMHKKHSDLFMFEDNVLKSGNNSNYNLDSGDNMTYDSHQENDSVNVNQNIPQDSNTEHDSILIKYIKNKHVLSVKQKEELKNDNESIQTKQNKFKKQKPTEQKDDYDNLIDTKKDDQNLAKYRNEVETFIKEYKESNSSPSPTRLKFSNSQSDKIQQESTQSQLKMNETSTSDKFKKQEDKSIQSKSKLIDTESTENLFENNVNIQMPTQSFKLPKSNILEKTNVEEYSKDNSRIESNIEKILSINYDLKDTMNRIEYKVEKINNYENENQIINLKNKIKDNNNNEELTEKIIQNDNDDQANINQQENIKKDKIIYEDKFDKVQTKDLQINELVSNLKEQDDVEDNEIVKTNRSLPININKQQSENNEDVQQIQDTDYQYKNQNEVFRNDQEKDQANDESNGYRQFFNLQGKELRPESPKTFNNLITRIKDHEIKLEMKPQIKSIQIPDVKPESDFNSSQINDNYVSSENNLKSKQLTVESKSSQKCFKDSLVDSNTKTNSNNSNSYRSFSNKKEQIQIEPTFRPILSPEIESNEKLRGISPIIYSRIPEEEDDLRLNFELNRLNASLSFSDLDQPLITSHLQSILKTILNSIENTVNPKDNYIIDQTQSNSDQSTTITFMNLCHSSLRSIIELVPESLTAQEEFETKQFIQAEVMDANKIKVLKQLKLLKKSNHNQINSINKYKVEGLLQLLSENSVLVEKMEIPTTEMQRFEDLIRVTENAYENQSNNVINMGLMRTRLKHLWEYVSCCRDSLKTVDQLTQWLNQIIKKKNSAPIGLKLHHELFEDEAKKMIKYLQKQHAILENLRV